MLKHGEIIKKLSDSEKIRILCNIRNLSDKSYQAKGIPSLRTDSFESLGAGAFPSPDALANAWDLPLVRAVADALAEKAVKKNTDLLSAPAPRARISPFRRALSEDPLLAAEISRAYLKAAARAKISACVGGFGLHGDETEWIDREPDERFLREFLTEPYRRVLSDEKCAVLNVFSDPDGGAYGKVNAALAEEARGSGDFGGALPVCGSVSPSASVTCLASGQLFFEGSETAAEAALSRCKKISEAARAEESPQSLEDALADGRALSPEMLDAAMDQLLDFVFSVKRRHALSDVSADPSLAFRAVSESLVLLKNEGGFLPISKGKKICLIGDIAFGEEGSPCLAESCAQALRALGHGIVGMAKGYGLDRERSTDGVAEAVSMASGADAVVLFLGIGETRAKKAKLTKRISLPANQMALLDSLGKYRDKIVAVLPSDELWAADFPLRCAAILTMPFSTAHSGAVLADALTGLLNPCGKLARTVSTGTEQPLEARLGIKTGVFLGYRAYNTAGGDVCFPFGHGLSYTQFEYTDLSVQDGNAFVTVKNVGACRGAEIVQAYAGKRSSAVVRPEKELFGFARAELNPGERKTVRIPLRLPAVYSREHGRCVTEAGDYAIFIGASVSDIRLSCEITADGETLAPDGKHLSEYIHTKSNILTHNYKLEAKVTKMKRSVCNLIAGCAAIVLAIVLKLYCTAMESEPQFFAWFELFLCLLGLWIFIAEAIHGNEWKTREKMILDQANAALFEKAEQIPEYNAASIFAETFERAEENISDEAQPRAQVSDAEAFAGIDKERDFETVTAEFEAFAFERGCKIRRDDVRKIFASLASSRLIVFGGVSAQNFRKLMLLLSDYCESASYVDGVDSSYTCAERVLFQTGSDDGKIKTGAMMAVESAKNAPGNIHFAGLSDVKCGALEAYFAPYLTYIKNPAKASVRIEDGAGAVDFYDIPRNLWFALNLADGESFGALPREIALSAAVLTLSVDVCPESETRAPVKPFGYYQMEYQKERMSFVCSPDEALWKKIDLLEEAVSRTVPFGIDNRHWLSFEGFAYAYMACGGDQYEAVDEAAAARLILPMMLARGDSCAESDFEETLEKIFGEDLGEACKKTCRGNR